jgi:hypothetical protein
MRRKTLLEIFNVLVSKRRAAPEVLAVVVQTHHLLTQNWSRRAQELAAMLLECFKNARPSLHVFLDSVICVHKFWHELNQVIQKILRYRHHSFQPVTEDDVALRRTVSVVQRIQKLQDENGDD